MSTISSSTTTTTAYKVTADTTGTLVLQTGATPTTAVTIDGSQNVGIGTSSPSQKLQVAGNARFGTGAYLGFPDSGGAFTRFSNGEFIATSGQQLQLCADNSDGTITFSTTSTGSASNERMRITSTGGVSFGATGTAYGTSGQVLTSAGNAPPTWITTLPVANGGTGVTTSTGSGAVVLGTSPTLTTPTINSAQVATVSGTAALYFCRAWVNFNATTATPSTIRGSGNVSSITKGSTGNYTINFTTAMPDTNYVVQAATVAQPVASNTSYNWAHPDLASSATGSCKVIGWSGNTGTNPLFGDNAYVGVAVFR